MSKTPTNGNHRWRFFRAGGVDQPRLDTGADLAALENLDQKLWVSLSCPVKGLEFDEKTLALIDSDKDGRVKVNEVIHAVKWAMGLLKDVDSLVKESETLPLAAINDSNPEGKKLLASANHVLAHLGKKDAAAIEVSDVSDLTRIFGQSRFNGDGIITDLTIEDGEAKKVFADIVATLGAETDRCGAPGVSQGKVDAFFTEAASYSEWLQKAEEKGSALLPFGEATDAAYAAYVRVKAKVDDYFARCRLAEYDTRAIAALNRQESDYYEVAAKDFSITAAEVCGFPLARVEAAKPLPLKQALNPAWADAIEDLRAKVVAPRLGADRSELTAADWTAILAAFAPYEGWRAAKPVSAVEKLGPKRAQEVLRGKARENLTALIAQDKALEPEVTSIASLERLIRYHRDLHRLLVNFVSFEDFYSRRRKAVFQAGSLYLDGRCCELCIRVEDSAKHATLAPLSKSYLAYCDCVRVSTGEKMSIAAAFTGGDSDHLLVGRNGLFYDRKGNDWDATIVRIVENPISIRQAFWSPYKRLMRWVEAQVAKRAAEADAAAAPEKLVAAVPEAGKPAAPGAPPAKSKFDVGVIAAMGVAVGGITAAFGAMMSAFFGLGMWMPAGVIAALLCISGPSMLIAWLKLRQRNLGPILDANGWAVNGRVRINVPFGGILTSVATLPPGSKRSLKDPYAPKKSPWPAIIIILLIVAAAAYFLNEKGKLHEWLGIGKEVAPAPVEAKDASKAPEVKVEKK